MQLDNKMENNNIMNNNLHYNMVFEEQLISLVRENDFLFNTKSKNYKNVLRRNLTWEEIGKQLQRPVGECRQRWKSIRDRFIKEKMRMESPSGSAAQEGNCWEFYDSLLFLTESIQTRRQTGNYASEETPETFSPLLADPDGDAFDLERTPTPSSKSRKRRGSNDFDSFLGGIKKTVMELAAPTSIPPPSLDVDEEFMLNMSKRMKPLNVAAKMRLHMKILEEINKELLADLN